MKTCRICGQEKELTAYTVRSDSGKHRNECKICWGKNKRSKIFTNVKNNVKEKLKSAKRKGHKVLIDWEYIERLYKRQNGKCALTGRSIDYTKENSLSIDRIDSKKPYQRGNIQLTCKAANYAKHTLSQEEFIRLCKDVVANCTK